MRVGNDVALRLLNRIFPVTFTALVISAISPAPVHAGFVITVQSVSAVAGSTNDTLNVTLTNTGTSPISIGGFAFQLTASNGVTFASVDTVPIPAYIFAGHSLFGPDITLQNTGSLIEAEDNYDVSGSGISLGVGSSKTVGLGAVHFKVASTANGPVAITLAGFPITNISDPNLNDITQSVGTTFTSGVVTVTRNTVVPEPSSLSMISLSLAMGLGYWKSRRRMVAQKEAPGDGGPSAAKSPAKAVTRTTRSRPARIAARRSRWA